VRIGANRAGRAERARPLTSCNLRAREQGTLGVSSGRQGSARHRRRICRTVLSARTCAAWSRPSAATSAEIHHMLVPRSPEGVTVQVGTVRLF
jgi:hypothetical protein